MRSYLPPPHRRNYLLPKFLAYYTLQETRVQKGWPRVRFAQNAA